MSDTAVAPTWGDQVIDRVRPTVTRAGRRIDLPAQEFKLLDYPMRHSGGRVTRTMLPEKVWCFDFNPRSNVIESHMSRLRAKVDRGFGREFIQMVRGRAIASTADQSGDWTRNSGRLPVRAGVHRRVRAAPDGGFEYQPLDASGRRMVGTIQTGAAHVGRGDVIMRKPGDDPDHSGRLVTLGTRLTDGALPVAASDGYDVDRLRHHVIWFTIGRVIIVTLLALLGGWWAGRLFLRRLAAVDAAVERIVTGRRLEQRPPAIGPAPERDELSRNLNRILDRIGGVRNGLRQVSTDVVHDLRMPPTRLRQPLCAPLAGPIETYEPVAADAWHRLAGPPEVPVVVDGAAGLPAEFFANPIENAILHTPAGTQVRTGIAREESGIVAPVADNGPGVAEAERADIPRRLCQRDSSRGSASARLGLSLAAASTMAHQARLKVGDSAPGLAVSVTFPHG